MVGRVLTFLFAVLISASSSAAPNLRLDQTYFVKVKTTKHAMRDIGNGECKNFAVSFPTYRRFEYFVRDNECAVRLTPDGQKILTCRSRDGSTPDLYYMSSRDECLGMLDRGSGFVVDSRLNDEDDEPGISAPAWFRFQVKADGKPTECKETPLRNPAVVMKSGECAVRSKSETAEVFQCQTPRIGQYLDVFVQKDSCEAARKEVSPTGAR